MCESVYGKTDIRSWHGLFVPAATPKDVVAVLNAEIAKVVARADMKSFVQDQGGVATSSAPAELGALLRAELAMWAKVVKAAGIKVE